MARPRLSWRLVWGRCHRGWHCRRDRNWGSRGGDAVSRIRRPMRRLPLSPVLLNGRRSRQDTRSCDGGVTAVEIRAGLERHLPSHGKGQYGTIMNQGRLPTPYLLQAAIHPMPLCFQPWATRLRSLVADSIGWSPAAQRPAMKYHAGWDVSINETHTCGRAGRGVVMGGEDPQHPLSPSEEIVKAQTAHGLPVLG